jgi:uncharacterized membrane protein
MTSKPATTRNNKQNSVGARNNKGKDVSAVVAGEFAEEHFSGPIPPPRVLEGYEKIVPGAAERILAMAESDMRHQQQYDNAILKASKDNIARGQILGFLIGIATISASIYSAILEYPWLAGILGGSTVVGLVTAFVVGRIIDRKS